VDVGVALRAGWKPEDLARAFMDGGARCLQIRAKDLPSNRFLDLCDTITSVAKPYDAAVIVNDRPDLALMSNAAGVHVGQEDLPPSQVRSLLGPAAVVGFSTHTTDQIEQASGEPVSYIAIGPVFGTRTKETGYDAVGLTQVTEAARRSKGLPIVAIGGITLDTATAVWRAGASSVAVISDLLEGADPAGRVRAYLRAAASVARL
jgi:thiamine-phosphate pyrophosphorylase